MLTSRSQPRTSLPKSSLAPACAHNPRDPRTNSFFSEWSTATTMSLPTSLSKHYHHHHHHHTTPQAASPRTLQSSWQQQLAHCHDSRNFDPTTRAGSHCMSWIRLVRGGPVLSPSRPQHHTATGTTCLNSRDLLFQRPEATRWGSRASSSLAPDE